MALACPAQFKPPKLRKPTAPTLAWKAWPLGLPGLNASQFGCRVHFGCEGKHPFSGWLFQREAQSCQFFFRVRVPVLTHTLALQTRGGDVFWNTFLPCEGPASLENVEAELPMADSPWASAVLELRRARCHRRQRKLEESEAAIGAALSLFPRFAAAMEEQGKLRIDQGRYQQAIHSFETLLHIDRTWPSLADWLVRVHTLKRRQESDVLAEKAEVVAGRTSQCLAWRQTGGCSPTGVLEPSADKPCTAAIVNGNSGFCQCTPLGARGASGSAAESTCDHVPFTCAQKCAERQQAESGQRPKLSEEEARLAAEVAKVAEATPCSLLRGGHVPEWCHSDHYRVLGLRCDFAATEESEELKRAYKRRSLQYHPDKPGGSALAFQRVADAHQVLLDPSKRRAFDEGSDFPRKRQQDGSEGETHKEEVEKKYFPDRFDFQPFGDPHSDRREAKARQDKLLERRRQEALARGARAEL
ncbi:unnamed protein product [Effrenium voratum]|nr:unnamed protein product [Effrenium voratum]